MRALIDLLYFKGNESFVSKDSVTFKPDRFPPSDDWVISTDRNGVAVSKYADEYWNFSSYGFSGFNFKARKVDKENTEIFKQIILFIMYGPMFPGSLKSCQNYFKNLAPLFEFCTSNAVVANRLCRYPALIEKLSDSLVKSRYMDTVTIFARLLIYKDEIGFHILDEKAIKKLVQLEPRHEKVQTPVIPPRIWAYQIKRLDECLEDFIKNQEKIKRAFESVAGAYEKNKGCKTLSPFISGSSRKKVSYPFNFVEFLKEYDIYDVFEKWMLNGYQKITLNIFSSYLTFVSTVSLFYIINYSIQRKGEVESLRTDCLRIEKDPVLGDIYILSGESTKTDPDSDARWIVPSNVKKAVDVANFVADLRKRFVPKNFSSNFQVTPYLKSPSYEPWSNQSGNPKSKDAEGNGNIKTNMRDYSGFISEHPNIFDKQEIIITESDYKVAKALTPNIDNKEWFGIGKPWQFSLHQLRRTLAVNMFSSEMVSDSSIQFSMKHLRKNMSFYYGRNYTKLRFHNSATSEFVIESYRATYRDLSSIVNDDIQRYVKPHKMINIDVDVVNLIEVGEQKKLVNLAKQGKIGCRTTLLGFCMKSGSCEYGGIESISKCAGGDGGNICPVAIFDRDKREALIKLKWACQDEMRGLDEESPRFKGLSQEVNAVEVYLNVIK